MPKVLFLINNLGRGGGERVFVNQSNYLYKEGYLVYLGLLFPSPTDSYESDVMVPSDQVITFGSSNLNLMELFLKVNRLVRQENINVVYSTLELPNIIARLLKIFNWHLRVVTREGSAVINSKSEVDIKPLKFKFLDAVINIFVSKIIAVSGEIETILKRHQPQYASKIICLENGILITESRDEVEKRLQKKDGQLDFKILAVASMNYYERAFEYLIDAINLLPEDFKNKTRLTFVGDGTLRPMYEDQVSRLGLENCIKFLGRLDTIGVQAEYKKADVFVLCSTSEGSPNVILEAESFGLPVITTRVGSSVTMVVEGKTGFFIPFKDSQAIADKILWLVEHEKERKDMGLQAYDHVVENFSFDKKMAELKNILLI